MERIAMNRDKCASRDKAASRQDKCATHDKAALRQDKIDKRAFTFLSCVAHLSFLSREAHSPPEGHLSPAGLLSREAHSPVQQKKKEEKDKQ
jgi:hypothetical protein